MRSLNRERENVGVLLWFGLGGERLLGVVASGRVAF